MGRTGIDAVDGGEIILMRRGWFALVPVLFFSNCQSPQEPLPYPLILNEEGLGSIRPGEKYDIALIQSKMPGFALEKLSRVTPKKAQTLLALKRNDTLLAHIFPDSGEERIEAITLYSGVIKDNLGQGIGDTIRDNKDLHCVENECRYRTKTPLRYRIDPQTRIIHEITLQKL